MAAREAPCSATDPNDKGRVCPLSDRVSITVTTPVANANALFKTTPTVTDPTSITQVTNKRGPPEVDRALSH